MSRTDRYKKRPVKTVGKANSSKKGISRKKSRKRPEFLLLMTLLLLGIIFLIITFTGGGKTADQSGNPLSGSKEVKLVSTATIGSMGDLLIHSPFLETYDLGGDNWDFNGIFKYIKPYIEKLDYAAINFEGTISNQERGYSAYPLFRLPAAVADSVKAAGFDLALTGNNHIMDGGSEGFAITQTVLKEKKLDVLGSRSAESQPKYLIKEINGIKVGMVNWTYGKLFDDGSTNLNGILVNSTNSRLIEIYDYERLDSFYGEQQKIIEEMRKKGAEAIVYFMHWGVEYKTEQNSLQREIAQNLCNLGVDAIIGGHPHVIQPIETFKAAASDHTMISIYSLGNAVSNQRVERMDLKTGHTEDGVLYTLTFSKYSDGKVVLSDAGILPTWVNVVVSDGNKYYEIVPIDTAVNWSGFLYSPDQVSAATASYNRTMELLAGGLEAWKALPK